MPKRLAAMLAATLLLVPALLGSSHTEGEEFLPFLFAVFAVTWAAFFAYAFFMSRKQIDLKREIESLRQALEDSDEQQALPPP